MESTFAVVSFDGKYQSVKVSCHKLFALLYTMTLTYIFKVNIF